jgi:hypothetical protein
MVIIVLITKLTHKIIYLYIILIILQKTGGCVKIGAASFL